MDRSRNVDVRKRTERSWLTEGTVLTLIVAAGAGAFNWLAGWAGLGSSEGLVLVPLAIFLVGMGATFLAENLESSKPIAIFGVASPFLLIGLMYLNDKIHVTSMQAAATREFLSTTGLSQLPRGCRAGKPYRQMGYLDFDCDGKGEEALARIQAELGPDWKGPVRRTGFWGPVNVLTKTDGANQVHIHISRTDQNPAIMNARAGDW